jgi:hypothetical protein
MVIPIWISPQNEPTRQRIAVGGLAGSLDLAIRLDAGCASIIADNTIPRQKTFALLHSFCTISIDLPKVERVEHAKRLGSLNQPAALLAPHFSTFPHSYSAYFTIREGQCIAISPNLAKNGLYSSWRSTKSAKARM